jgi:Flp pilus assembly protein TadD
LVAFSGQVVLLVLALAALLSQVALALTGSQVYERVKDSVVVVKAYDRAGKAVGLGSGVVLPSGDIVTNYHVVKAGVRYTVGQKGKAVPAFLQGSDPDKDLALLLAPGLTATPARLGQASRLKVGEPVYAVGAPQGLELSLSEGIVSQLRGGPPAIIQTTAAISPGSSGGGLFNAQGELVGIVTFYLKEGQSLNFALPVEWVKEVATSSTPGRGGIIGKKGPVVPAPGQQSTGGWSDRAAEFIRSKDWQGLLAHCRRWTRAEPDNSLAWFSLGVAYFELGRHRESIEAFRETLRLKPDDAKAWYNLGLAYEKLGRYREEIKAYREALRLQPDYAKAWNNLGLAYGKLGRYREEIKAYREALCLKPDDVKVWNNLGTVYAELGRHREAIKASREALRLKPDDAGAWNNLAIAYFLSGNRSAALKAVKELRRHDPQQADKVFNLIMKP